MDTKRIRFCICILLIVSGVLFHSLSLFSKAYYNDEQYQKEMKQIDNYVKNKDIKGLIRIVEKGEIRSAEEAARWLGEIGNESAIPILEKMNQSYSTFICHPSGEFAIAICKIKNRNKSDIEKIKALLKLAQGNVTSVASLAAIEISKFNNPSVLPELKKLETYGAVQAVIKIEALNLTQEQKISKYIQILKEHKTPLLAEGAENLLIEIGEPVVLKVVELLKQIDTGQSNTLRESFHVNATVAVRCIHILEKIGNRTCILAIGEKIYDKNLYVKGSAVLSLQRITGENFGFNFMHLRMEKDKEKFQKKAQESIKRTQEWWEKNKHGFKVREEFMLTIETDKKSYRVGDKIRLYLYFENKSDNVITAAIGRRHFSSLDVYKNNEKLKMGVLYDVKDAQLGFWQNDYQRIKPKERKKIIILARIEKFSNRKLMAPSINYTGFAIVSKNIGFLFEEPGRLQLKLKYEPQFPKYKDEAIHSAYHKMKDVWKKPLVSNIIEIFIED